MLYTIPKVELSKSNKQIELTLFAKEFSEMISNIEKEEVNLDLFTKAISFLKEAKRYAEGQESYGTDFMPSDAFNFTLRAVDFNLLHDNDITDIIEEIIDALHEISNGDFDKREFVLGFFFNITRVISSEIERPNKLTNTLL
ncbi:hypothetical protein MUN89_00920 [Halobacillus salinarum]|uniref:Uncharacterized protein n=1 Tax=Halobacillus salinarum TaxID=2932257 RepID=A0ABY4EJB3_9BACI|nr:hypothetical protein [Halobacillus salinarum]UOQ44574.1 hypothetical protein MUN89_00920 [Halobacillus salinarum]